MIILVRKIHDMSQGKTVERLRRKAKGPSICRIMAASYHLASFAEAFDA